LGHVVLLRTVEHTDDRYACVHLVPAQIAPLPERVHQADLHKAVVFIRFIRTSVAKHITTADAAFARHLIAQVCLWSRYLVGKPFRTHPHIPTCLFLSAIQDQLDIHATTP